MKALKVMLAAMSAGLAFDSFFGVVHALTGGGHADLINNSAGVVIFSIYPLWFWIRRRKESASPGRIRASSAQDNIA